MRCSGCSRIVLAVSLVFTAAGATAEDPDLPAAKPVPAVQVLPLPYQQASFQHLGRELTRYHFGPGLERPFWYPLVGPEGKSLTRMGHPRDPQSHRHHNSVWISHDKVGGVSFWADGTGAKIVCQQVVQYEDGPQEASMVSLNAWQDKAGKTVMIERRRTAVRPLGADEWLMLIDLQLEAPASGPVTLGETPFGLIGVRMAKTIGVHDGGGRILNSAGQVNEAQAFRQPAKWVDYSGPVTDRARGGIALTGSSLQSRASDAVPRARRRLDGGLADAAGTVGHPTRPALTAPVRALGPPGGAGAGANRVALGGVCQTAVLGVGREELSDLARSRDGISLGWQLYCHPFGSRQTQGWQYNCHPNRLVC